eukprot:7796115-Pyramimonas_sp.AAC.1
MGKYQWADMSSAWEGVLRGCPCKYPWPISHGPSVRVKVYTARPSECEITDSGLDLHCQVIFVRI